MTREHHDDSQMPMQMLETDRSEEQNPLATWLFKPFSRFLTGTIFQSGTSITCVKCTGGSIKHGRTFTL